MINNLLIWEIFLLPTVRDGEIAWKLYQLIAVIPTRCRLQSSGLLLLHFAATLSFDLSYFEIDCVLPSPVSWQHTQTNVFALPEHTVNTCSIKLR